MQEISGFFCYSYVKILTHDRSKSRLDVKIVNELDKLFDNPIYLDIPNKLSRVVVDQVLGAVYGVKWFSLKSSICGFYRLQ